MGGGSSLAASFSRRYAPSSFEETVDRKQVEWECNRRKEDADGKDREALDRVCFLDMIP